MSLAIVRSWRVRTLVATRNLSPLHCLACGAPKRSDLARLGRDTEVGAEDNIRIVYELGIA